MGHLLILDAGLTTGWAIFDLDGGFEKSGNIPFSDILETGSFIKEQWRPEVIVIEEPLPFGVGPLATQLRETLQLLQGFFLGSTTITAAQWKGSRESRTPLPEFHKGWTQHQKDSYRIGLWYLARHKSVSN